MSHFTVLVVGDNWEEQLAQYDENLDVDPYKVFLSEKEAALALSYKEDGETEESAISDWVGYDTVGQEDGKWYYMSTRNPKSKWDWYLMGGRWTGFFKIKPGSDGKLGKPGLMTAHPDNILFVDQCKKIDLDIEGMQSSAIEEASLEWDRLDARMRKLCFPDSKTKDDVIDRASKSFLTTFAFVKDGDWFERGKMGWFATVSDAQDEESWKSSFMTMFKSLPDDTTLTIVDCHI